MFVRILQTFCVTPLFSCKQVEEFCIERRARYFALSTYEVTWFGCIRDRRLLISRGFPWLAQGPSVRQVRPTLCGELLDQHLSHSNIHHIANTPILG